MLNNVVLMGRLTDKPELRKTANDISVTSFTIALDRRGKDNQTTDWVDCVAWRQTAEFIEKYFGKGDMIAVTGSIQTRNYEDKNGNKRKAVEVLIDNVSFCGGKREKDDEAPTSASAPQERPSNFVPTIQSSPRRGKAAESPFEEVGTENDLPF